MKPFTTATNPAHATLVSYPSAAKTLEVLDRLITDARVEPSKSVTKARNDIAAIADDEAHQLADVEHIRTHGGLKLTEALEVLTQSKNNTAVTDQQRYEATARLLTGGTLDEAKELRRLHNQILFYRSREAAQRLRALGDDLVVGLLDPWAHRINDELAAVAPSVTPRGWDSIHQAEQYRLENLADLTEDELRAEIDKWNVAPQSVGKHLAVLRAHELAAEFVHVTDIAIELRAKGILATSADDALPGTAYSFRYLSKLPTTRIRVSREGETVWLCEAVTCGAELACRTARQAEAAKPLPPIEIGL